MDERRRRRIVVNSESGKDAATAREVQSLPACVPAELCAASPWIPFSRWKLWTLTGLLLGGLTGVLVTMQYAPSFRPELAPALDPLFRGEQPKFVTYLETVFWVLSGQLALLIGWHRSHSRLDFRGRYRVWPWAAAMMFFCSLCAATNLHLGLGTVIEESGFFEQFRTRIGWRVPALCLMLPLWMLVDRDVRRSRSSVVMVRLAFLTLSFGTCAGLYRPATVEPAIWSVAELASGLFGSALLMVSLWVQGWYVAYVTPDPPVASPWRWPNLAFGLFAFIGWMLSLVFGLFKRNSPPAPKRKKKAEESGAAPKRKRQTKRPARRKKVVEEEEAAEEEEEETEAESEEEEELEEEDAYEEETPPARVTAPAAKSQPVAKSGSGWNSRSDDEEEEEDEDAGGTQWRIDGPSPDQLKGLSKRQRRALIKQHRDQQRQH
jgi:hypothetical protein